MFEGLFKLPAENVNLYLSQPNYVEQVLNQGGNQVRFTRFSDVLCIPNLPLQKETIEGIYNSLVKNKPTLFEECIAWARLKFEDLYSNTIKQLLFNFPKDAVTSSGTPFWSGPKRAPDPITFDPENVSEQAHLRTNSVTMLLTSRWVASPHGLHRHCG